jgi:Na+-transporting NADH:ubiquinone oxidoreductase subunit B
MIIVKDFKIPDKPFLLQKPHVRVCYALTPIVLASIYIFGWRALAIVALAFPFGALSEAVFTFRQGKSVTSAVFVTCMIFSLSLPPTIPLWMVIVGIVFGVVIGKMAFGGFGQNIFNPAMVGRCFLYITFPIQLTNSWMEPMWGGLGGFVHWANSADAVTRATPLVALRNGASLSSGNLFFGNIPGSLGETSALLILLGGAFIIYKKAASWRLALSCLLGGTLVVGVLHGLGFPTVPTPVSAIISGSFLFGTAFVATEPISGAKTKPGQWIYGGAIGGLTMVLRGFSNFSAGVMFATLIMNAFVPVLDQTVRRIQGANK